MNYVRMLDSLKYYIFKIQKPEAKLLNNCLEEIAFLDTAISHMLYFSSDRPLINIHGMECSWQKIYYGYHGVLSFVMVL